MKEYLGLEDGDITTALVCFTDIAGFVRTVRSLSLEQIAALLRRVSSIISQHVGDAPGEVVKYIGDASLLVFPPENLDGTIRRLLSMKREIEIFFESNYPDLSITFSSHFGEIILVRLEPLAELDILGDTVSRAFLIGSQVQGGNFVISKEVFERLSAATRGQFRDVDVGMVYTAL